MARLKGPEWNFVTVLPERVVSAAALRSARYVLVFGLASLLLELIIMYWVLQRQIAQPLLALTQAADHVASGDFQVELNASRRDELGQLASAFRTMSDKVRQREEQLRQANDGLEQRVEERTRELKAVHGQLVQTARQAGMAEIATNVLHNVGNVLNSVYTSSSSRWTACASCGWSTWARWPPCSRSTRRSSTPSSGGTSADATCCPSCTSWATTCWTSVRRSSVCSRMCAGTRSTSETSSRCSRTMPGRPGSTSPSPSRRWWTTRCASTRPRSAGTR
ncbi:HAMP domain-containing protein [Cystobacter fuscus]